MKGYLILEDGTIFQGEQIGSTKEVISEIVFNTGMTGYLEVMTDPSYGGQSVVMTYPLIGNYGICHQDMESEQPWVSGMIVREFARKASNFRSEESIQSFLEKYDTPGLSGIDTRALVKMLRDKGTMNGMITTQLPIDMEDTLVKIKNYKIKDIVAKVTSEEIKEFNTLDREYKETVSEYKYKVALIDYGLKNNIPYLLEEKGCKVTVYPAFTLAKYILADCPDGIMLSNGPGDPKECHSIIQEIKNLYDSEVPIFGICLGHQLLALATGGDTEKMKYGHRGYNHPVKDLFTGKVYITSQNHGYMVKKESIHEEIAEINFINVNDQTVEGLHYLGKNIFTVQFHPEACGGPQDTEFLFDQFIHMMEVKKHG